MLDFNDVSTQPTPPSQDAQRAALKDALLARLESVLQAMFPAGQIESRTNLFRIGDIAGRAGDSLEVVLDGEKRGLWIDRATGDGGDLFDLIAKHAGLDVRTQFPRVCEQARHWLGIAPVAATPAPTRRRGKRTLDERGEPTARWNYSSADGQLLACVYRYDLPDGKKEFRPYDVKRKRWAAPTPRPLYNLAGMAMHAHIVVVEGEKCAHALIDRGVCATTAMHGANAPVDKTDWTPLAGKHVLLWPDKDKAGWTYAENVAQAALLAGAADCAILLPPEDKPDGWDCADGIAEGFDVEGFLREGPRQAIAAAPLRADDELFPDDPSPDVIEAALQGLPQSTERVLASLFAARYGADWRFVDAWGKWLTWTGTHWSPDQRRAVYFLAMKVCTEAAALASTVARAEKLASNARMKAVVDVAATLPQLTASVNDWDTNAWQLNTPSGTLDLREGTQQPHQRTDHITRITQAGFASNRTCPTWIAFLRQVTGNDERLVAYLQRVAGYCLTGVTSEHALFFLYGTGANGKSVFVNVLSTILGTYAATAPMDAFMDARGDRHPTDLAGLRGARLVISTETEQGRRWHEAKIKAITGGDMITARFMRQDFFEYRPQFKLLIAGNHKPAIRNVDEAMRRRLHLIPFTVTIAPEKRDPKLTEKLLAESEAILAWAAAGTRDWLRIGLSAPPIVQEATAEYFEEEDQVGEFLDEECERRTGAREAIALLFARWRERQDRRNEHSGTSRWLVQQLIARGFTRARLSGGTKALQGLALKPRDLPGHLPYCDN